MLRIERKLHTAQSNQVLTQPVRAFIVLTSLVA
nr:MAG TPA_asm: hypothetical protein [Caudoviricetes sp.]